MAHVDFRPLLDSHKSFVDGSYGATHPADRSFDPDELCRRLELYLLQKAAEQVLSRQCSQRLTALITTSSSPDNSSTSAFNLEQQFVNSEHALPASVQIPIAAPCTNGRPSMHAVSGQGDDDKAVPESEAHLKRGDACKDSSTTRSTNASTSNMATAINATNAHHAFQNAEQRDKTVLLKAGDTYDTSRRKTLQTVSELSSPTQSLPEWTSGSSTVTNNSSQLSGDKLRNGVLTRPTASGDQVPSLPNIPAKSRRRSTGFEKYVQPRPSILITSPDEVPIQPVRRSVTAPLNMGQRVLQAAAHDTKDGARSGGNRLSVTFAFRGKDVNENGALSAEKRRSSGPGGSRSSASHETHVKTQNSGQSNNHLGLQLKQTGSLQEQRDREGSKREQAAMDVQTRRRSGRGLSVGSSSTLPSMSPLPLTKPAPAYVGSRMSQQQLLQNSRSMNGMNGNAPSRYLDRRISTGQLQQQTEKRATTDIDAQFLKRASTSNMNVNRRASNPNMLHQQTIPESPLYSALNPKRSSRVLSQHSPMPLLLGSPTSMSFSIPQSPTTQYPFPRPPSGTYSDTRPSRSRSITQSQPAPPRSPSAHSNASSKSNLSKHSTKSRQSSTSRSSSNRRSRRTQRGITQEHLDALAALTAPAPAPSANMTPESLALLASQQRIVDEKMRRASVASERAARIELARERSLSRSRGSHAGSRISQHSHPHSRPNIPNPNLNPLSEKHHHADVAMAPESIRLLREREKLVRWRAERDKIAFEKREREKIRERVKRANELEEERSRSLEKMKGKGRRRGCCGLFGG